MNKSIVSQLARLGQAKRKAQLVNLAMSDATNPRADARINLFLNAFNPVPVATCTLAEAIEAIAAGKYRSPVCAVRQVLARQGKRAYDKAKANLPALTFGGTFAPKRGIAQLQQHSGLIHGDLDHLPDVNAAKRTICSDPRTVYAFKSPSIAGLKVGVRGPIVADGAEYEYAWRVVSAEYARLHEIAWDQTGRDVSRLCYVSWDPEAYWNPHAIMFEVLPPPAPEPPPPPQPRMATYHPPHDRYDYADRAIRTATEMIQAAQLGTRHHTRLRAARLLGGYVAGGLLSEEQAYGALAQALVGYTEDLARALKTVEDGLTYGAAHPITIEALDAQRQEWIQQHRNAHPRQQWTPPDDPWDGTNTLLLKPYLGYRGLRSRMRGKGATSGHSS